MQSVSAIIIAKNEEEMIADAIASVSFCDEIIVVDGGSIDRTVALAKKQKAHVFEFRTNDFSQARNFGKKKAKSEWILYIDADERVTKELALQIKTVLAHPQSFRAYRIKRKNYYFSTFAWPSTERLERFFQAKSLKEWYGRLHESANIEGEVGELDGFLVHFTHRSLSDMLIKTLAWSTVEADLRLKSNHPQMAWWRFFRVMLSAFYSSYISQKGWRVGTAGLIESMYQSYSAFVTYAKLWELQEKSHTA